MKKQGFTLAEVLITLGLLGVVAAITLPALFNNVEKHKWENGLKAAYNIMTNGFAEMMAEEGVDNLKDTALWRECGSGDGPTNMSCSSKHFKKYFNVVLEEGGIPAGMKLYDIQNTDVTNRLDMHETTRYTLSNNISLNAIFYNGADKSRSQCNAIKEKGGSVCTASASIYVDVNGNKKPNTVGKDIYYFDVDNYGKVYPMGGLDETLYHKNDATEADWKSTCNGKPLPASCSGYDSLDLTARVVEDGYRINYLK